jgi:hypothetical protein
MNRRNRLFAESATYRLGLRFSFDGRSDAA